MVSELLVPSVFIAIAEHLRRFCAFWHISELFMEKEETCTFVKPVGKGIMNRIAYYPGSFDPMTNGHMDLLKQAVSLVDEIVIGIGVHPGKVPMFSFKERAELVSAVTSSLDIKITVQSFDNLVVDAAHKAGASLLIRGVRDGSDLDYEMQMSGMNGTMRPEITTVLLPAAPQTRHITATLVRQIAKMGGDVSPFVPGAVNTALKTKLSS